MITEDTMWLTNEGVKIPIRDLEDSHLLNIIQHIQENCGFYSKYLAPYFIGIAEKRGLKVLSKKIPYKRFGRWILWTPDEIKLFVGERKLDVDICKKCKLQEYDGYWSDEDEQYFKEGKSICFKECRKWTDEDVIPGDCNYSLEQVESKVKDLK